jgi:FkbM family methyltransferase
MWLPKHAPITAAITTGTYEQAMMRFVVAMVGADDVCYDIGGHYGYFTLSFAKLATHGQVHTFEPVAQHVTRIEKSVQRSGIRNVTVHHAALADRVGEMTLCFAESSGDDSMGYLDAYGGVNTPAAHEHYGSFSRTVVRTLTLDSLCAELPPPRFIKIDAEGAEGAILSAGRSLIRQFKPRLLIELHGIQEALQCAQILSDLDYRAVLLTNQKITMPVLWVPREDEEAVACVRGILGCDPTVFFDSVPANAKARSGTLAQDSGTLGQDDGRS